MTVLTQPNSVSVSPNLKFSGSALAKRSSSRFAFSSDSFFALAAAACERQERGDKTASIVSETMLAGTECDCLQVGLRMQTLNAYLFTLALLARHLVNFSLLHRLLRIALRLLLRGFGGLVLSDNAYARTQIKPMVWPHDSVRGRNLCGCMGKAPAIASSAYFSGMSASMSTISFPCMEQ